MTDSSELEISPGFIPPHGGYEQLQSYQMSLLVYDATVKFCDRFISPASRTHDQMVQAARSGNKNIAEGSQVSGTSKKMELKLTGVARASLEELLGDYRDFLRQRGLAEWGKDDPMAAMIRRLAYKPNRSYQTYATYIENAPPEVAANTMLCLVNQANYLLDQQIRQLERAFLREGGFTERLYRARNQARNAAPGHKPAPQTTAHLDPHRAPPNTSNPSYPGRQTQNQPKTKPSPER